MKIQFIRNTRPSEDTVIHQEGDTEEFEKDASALRWIRRGAAVCVDGEEDAEEVPKFVPWQEATLKLLVPVLELLGVKPKQNNKESIVEAITKAAEAAEIVVADLDVDGLTKAVEAAAKA